ncbi:ABC transporter permease [Gracilibacillus halophilus YIM-C55.5]|uniref:ABC transporter permease n=1 Tax=Gracilibacillus halophilus YIM-C55.5 TaxID=1308866 RepID=N4W6J9_9BACI|nr:ABC transporter permease subunit [Gracilibacillus halophilus]ENH95848.1 ABC transporter permease [Gracilibacillus halophilus YIM-C55.5]
MFWSLIRNEWMKVFNRTSTYVMIGLLIVGVLITAIYTFYQQKDQQLPSEEEWRSELMQQNEEYLEQEKTTINRYIKSHAINQQAINEYRLEHNISPYDKENVWSYMESNTSLTQMIGVFVILIGASIVSLEFKQGTAKLLLVRSASRLQILFAKFATVILFGLFLLVILFMSSIIIGGSLFGFDASSTHISASNGEVFEWSRTLYVGVDYLSNSITVFMLSAFAFMISTMFRSDSIAIAISIMLLFIGTMATNILGLITDWARFSLFANTDLTVYFSGGPMVEDMTFSFSIVMLILYLSLFLTLAGVFFKKRDVSI